jgi:hypothetical protein
MLLVPHENVGDLLLSVESVVNSDCVAAGHSKDKLHAFGLKNVNDGLTATLHHHCLDPVFVIDDPSPASRDDLLR